MIKIRLKLKTKVDERLRKRKIETPTLIVFLNLKQ